LPFPVSGKGRTFFDAETFLDDVKYAIKQHFHNQAEFAKLIPISRNALSRVINDPDGLDSYWMNLFAHYLHLDLRTYIRQKDT